MTFPTDSAAIDFPGLEGDSGAARLGAPAGGLLEGPSLQRLLATVLAMRPGGRVFLSPSLLPHWGHRIEDAGGRPMPLPDRDPSGVDSLRAVLALAVVGDQVWLDLGGQAAPAPVAAVEAFLEQAGARPEPPLVVLLRDDDPARVRTHRLAVDRPGQVVLLREASAGRAYALARPALIRELAAAAAWPAQARPFAPLSGAKGQLLVLDVDGVLIDPGRAFLEAVAGALGELVPGLAWGDAEFQAFKRAGGFNNDFRLTAGAMALAEQGGVGALAEAAGAGLADLEQRIRELEPQCRPVVQKHYARSRRLERPMVTREELAAFPGELAIYTGRPPRELQGAFEVLGFVLPAVGDSAAHLRKPRPEGLIQLADAFRAERITFVGDTIDDAEALRAARALRPDRCWRFGAVGAGRGRFAQEGDLQAAGLKDLLAQFGGGNRP